MTTNHCVHRILDEKRQQIRCLLNIFIKIAFLASIYQAVAINKRK